MRFDLEDPSSIRNRRRFRFRYAMAALGLVGGAALMQTSAAAEMELVGTGTFKPPQPELTANVPVGFMFTKSDLASGTWSFAVRYEDRTPDSDPDPYVGRYGGAVRACRLRVGSTTVDLPVDQGEILISDGGLGFPERESIRVQVTSRTPYGVIQVAWVQIHQTATRADLRGGPGLLASDALPRPSLLADLPTDRRFDKYLLLRLDSSTQAQPLLYLSSSTLSVSGSPVATP